MADEDRSPSYALAASSAAAQLYEALHAAPFKFDFFQALRRIDAVNQDRPRLGESPRAADDPVRLRQPPSVVFAPSTLAQFEPAREGRAAMLSTYFFGMFGPNGPLPLHLTEYARDRIRNSDDPTFVRFIDIFHHRMLTLFYRSWAAAQPVVAFDRPSADRFGTYVGSLFGIGTAELRDRDAMPDLAKLHFAGRLSLHTRNAEGLAAILADFLKIPVEIEQFVPDWVSLPRQALCLLGKSTATGMLGSTASIGAAIRVWHHKFRIRLGPMTLAEYRRVLPGGRSLERISPLVRNYIGDELSWDVNLILFKDEVPPLKLGEAGRLGWTSWLGVRESETDAADLVLEPDLLPSDASSSRSHALR